MNTEEDVRFIFFETNVTQDGHQFFLISAV